MCRKFTEEHLKPVASKCDIAARFPYQQIQKLTDVGLMSACLNDEYGGLELDYLSLAIAIEELSKGCASTGMILSIHNFLYTNLVNERGTEKQKDIFLKQYGKGSIGCFALSEPGAGSDVANIKTTAVQDGNYWILNGKKSWVTSAIEGKAMAVFATFDKELRHKGHCTSGFLSFRAATACDVTLEEVRVPNDYLVGEIGEGFRIAMAQLDQGRIGIAAHAVGIAQTSLDTAIEYAKERVAFGKPLSRLPSVKDRLTEMSVLVETARLLTYRAATQVCTKNSAMAKYVAGRNATAVADHCVQILGGNGLSTRYNAERHYRTTLAKKSVTEVAASEKNSLEHVLKNHELKTLATTVASPQLYVAKGEARPVVTGIAQLPKREYSNLRERSLDAETVSGLGVQTVRSPEYITGTSANVA
ncbi:Short-chain specific acyl-CoA dehydrogenase, mitochondrial [Eumeta japonica]|uniref:Short-chain specific acyl-CoA dehydrogenase, mitochondrial n=1 Tax=Eumeta variegata TaxID=151549 RepID=A0A4C1X1E5_EUMVA|nr:Short-chain specific acyl-CoA dehydrogenase, mitochondrial [Eumeta japonica]